MNLNQAIFNRERQSQLTSFGTPTMTIYSGPGCTSSMSTLNSGPITGVYRQCFDVKTPDFKARSAAGEIINSPFEKYFNTFTSTGGQWQRFNPSFNCTSGVGGWKAVSTNILNYYMGPLPTFHNYVIDDGPLIARAAVAALANIKAPEVLGSAMIKELSQTYSSIRHPLASLRRIIAKHNKLVKELNRIDALYRRQRRGEQLTPSQLDTLNSSSHIKNVTGKGQLNDFSGQYLELVFGILPTMRDLSAIVDTLSKVNSERDTARGKFVDNYSSTTSSVYKYGAGWPTIGWYATQTTTVNETCTVRAGALYDARVNDLGSRLGVDLHSMPAFLWEVMPWSFVVDWFSNAGDYIVALQNSLTQNTLAQWVSVKRVATVTRASVETENDPAYVMTQSQAVDTGVYELFQRVPMNLGSHISLKLDLNFDRVNVGAALALTMQQLTRR